MSPSVLLFSGTGLTGTVDQSHLPGLQGWPGVLISLMKRFNLKRKKKSQQQGVVTAPRPHPGTWEVQEKGQKEQGHF